MTFKRLNLFLWLPMGAIFVFLPFFAQANPVFNDLQWNNRVLVITGDENDPLFFEQVNALRPAVHGLEEREIIVLRFGPRIVEKIQGLSPFPFRDRVINDGSERRYLESVMNTQSESFSVLLIGLDGELKQTWREVVASSDVFEAVDAMPMRQGSDQSINK